MDWAARMRCLALAHSQLGMVTKEVEGRGGKRFSIVKVVGAYAYWEWLKLLRRFVWHNKQIFWRSRGSLLAAGRGTLGT